MLPREFGHYQLLELLGTGGMGEVYRATDSRHDREVAIKLLPEALGDDGEYTSRFRRESRVAARLREPHVIPIHDFGEIDGRLYIDMRLVDGVDVGKVLQQGPIPPARTVHLISQVAEALDAAHDDGLVHRDVKPSNVLLTRTDFVYVVDFGIARSIGTVSTALTVTGAAVGTLDYMAPERFTLSGIDRRTDVYSLACLLHECLTAHRPFIGRDLPSLMYAHLWSEPPRPSELVEDLPGGLDAVIRRGMAKEATDRYPTAGALAEAARAALLDPTPARPAAGAAPATAATTDRVAGSPAGPAPEGATVVVRTGTPVIADPTRNGVEPSGDKGSDTGSDTAGADGGAAAAPDEPTRETPSQTRATADAEGEAEAASAAAAASDAATTAVPAGFSSAFTTARGRGGRLPRDTDASPDDSPDAAVDAAPDQVTEVVRLDAVPRSWPTQPDGAVRSTGTAQSAGSTPSGGTEFGGTDDGPTVDHRRDRPSGAAQAATPSVLRHRRRARLAGVAVLALAVAAATVIVIREFGPAASAAPGTGTVPVVAESTPASATPDPGPTEAPVAASIAVPTAGEVIPVGPTPGYMHLAPNGRFGYIASRGAGHITVLDTTINKVTATIPIPQGPPQFLSFSPTGDQAYVSVFDPELRTNVVVFVDTGTNTVTQVVPVGRKPYASATTLDGRLLYVPSHDDGRLDVIDTTSAQVVAEIPVARNPHWVAFSRDGRFLYTANHESGVLSVLDATTNAVLTEIDVGVSPHSTAVSPDGSRVSVVNFDSNEVSVIDTATNQVVATVPVGLRPQDIAYAPDGRFLYTANVDDDTVSVISAQTNQVTATIATGDAPTSISVMPDGKRAYVTNLNEGTVRVLDIAAG